MAEQYYDLAFSGELLEGYYIDFVKADLQSLFKTSDSYIEALFSGPNQTVKLKVDKATAIKYQKAFKKAGAKLIVRLHNPQPAEQKPQTNSAPASPPVTKPVMQSNHPGEVTTTMDAVAGENSDELVEHHQPDIQGPETIPQWAVAAPGSQLIEAEELPTADIDTSALSLAESGADLLANAHRFEEPAPIINVDNLSLAPAGADIEVLDDKPAPVSVDVSHLKVE